MPDNTLTNTADRTWLKVIANYNHPGTSHSIWQLVDTFIPYVVLWVAMYLSLSVSYWLVLLLAIPASGFLIRLFIIFHDCGHGSFLSSKRANDLTGILLGILTFTPYYSWHHSHMIHHRTAGNLDKRGTGDVWTLTVEEYRALSKNRQRAYRIYRHPLVMFGLGAALMFFFSHRVTRKYFGKKERKTQRLCDQPGTPFICRRHESAHRI